MWTQADREIHREIRKRYPSDLTDGEWALTVPFFATYRPLSTTIRAIMEACLHLVAEGCRWRALPKDFPPWQTVRWWWDRFRREGVWDRATRAPAGAPGLRPDPAPLARRAGLRHPDDPQQASRPRLGAAAGGVRDDDARRQPPSPHPCCRSGMLKSNRV